jgi:enamine deaminase RidA (YjgF/YER057c/UK114 family)
MLTAPLFKSASRVGDTLYVSGQLPLVDGILVNPGLVGTDVTLDEARQAATACVANCLQAIERELGSLDAVVSVAKLNGYVAAGAGFYDAAAVIDAASEALIDALGERGRHARLAIGVAGLPRNACVEVEVIVQLA